jgi:hypothetical protein
MEPTRETIVGTCVCGDPVTWAQITATQRQDDGHWLIQWDHESHVAMGLLHPPHEEKEMAMVEASSQEQAFQEAPVAPDAPVETDEGPQFLGPQQIGLLVQGFRIDLDAVETLADITLFWDDQARWGPSVPQEAV